MAQRSNSPLLRYLHKLFENQEAATLTDRQLLQRFATDRSEAAFTVLVRRHGGMVLGVCSRVLNDPTDAEDAFQATFLVLARQNMSLRWQDSIGNWLYGVALRVAGKMRSQRRRTQAALASLRTASVVPSALDDPGSETIRRELADKLDAALQRLSSKYRAPLVLCYLEGRTHQEAARELGLPAGSISRRVRRALELLRERLAQSNLCLSHEALAALLANGIWRAMVERTLAERTAQAALLFKIGAWAAIGTASTRIITLAEGVLRTMILTPLKFILVGILTIGLLGAGGALHGRRMVEGSSNSVQDEPLVEATRGDPSVGTNQPKDPDELRRQDSAEKRRKYELTRLNLSKPVVLERGLERMTFGEAKNYLEDRFNVNILANPKVFAKGEKLLEMQVQLDKMSGVSLRSVLDMLVDQVGATCVVHTDYVEITTPKFARPESWVTGDRTFVPRVHVDFKDMPLDEALRELAIDSGFPIVLDRRGIEPASMPRVAALLESACLDTAVEMLANMAGLKAVALDRSLYVTKEENADKLWAQQEQRRAAHEKYEKLKKEEKQKAAGEKKAKEQAQKRLF